MSSIEKKKLDAFVLFLNGLRNNKAERLYVVADAARNRSLVEKAEKIFDRPTVSLRGNRKEHVRYSSPHFFEVNTETSASLTFLSLWIENLGTSSGIMFYTSVPEKAIREQLRHMFIVSTEHGGNFFFRFYDPRVLRPYLPTCSLGELDYFFGPVASIVIEGPNEGELYVASNPESRQGPVMRCFCDWSGDAGAKEEESNAVYQSQLAERGAIEISEGPLILRDAQLAIFPQILIDEANKLLLEYGKERYPEVFGAAPKHEMLDLIQHIRTTAEGYGVLLEEDTKTFFDLSVQIGVNFHLEERMNEILRSNEINGAVKMECLRILLTEASSESGQ